MSSHHVRVNPVEYIQKWYKNIPKEVNFVFDPSINKKTGRWFRGKQHAHDGTAWFTFKLINEIFDPIVNGNSFCLKDMTVEEFNANVIGITYYLGWLNVVSIEPYSFVCDSGYKMTNGVRERARIYLKAEYKLKEQDAKLTEII